MQSLVNEDELVKEGERGAWRGEAVVMEMWSQSGLELSETACKPLWLTPVEAEALLVLCVISPASGGACEQELFGKLSAYIRLFA